MSDERMDQVAEYLHAEFGLSVPLDLALLSEKVGIGVVREMEIPELGRVSYSSATPTITLRRSLSLPRKRFTWAHEIGHVLLDGPYDAYRSGSHSGTLAQAKERDCDRLAAALLMPRPWALKMFSKRRLTLSRLEAARKSANVSWTAAFRRSKSLFPSQQAFISFRRGAYLQCVGLNGAYHRPDDYAVTVGKTCVWVELIVGSNSKLFRADLRGDHLRGCAILDPVRERGPQADPEWMMHHHPATEARSFGSRSRRRH
ncbi:MAG: hypothetical protein DHS20C19_02140 [Acidimicrobiales bacterium]|nr:MAG: hypothetical protein DHS20C19_02140 [Acidimicrobiales bacterium]